MLILVDGFEKQSNLSHSACARLEFAPACAIEVPKVVFRHSLERMIRSRGAYIRQVPILEIMWYSQSGHGKRNIYLELVAFLFLKAVMVKLERNISHNYLELVAFLFLSGKKICVSGCA